MDGLIFPYWFPVATHSGILFLPLFTKVSECSALALIRVGYFCEMFDPFSCLVLINKEARALDLLFQSAIVCVCACVLLLLARQTTIVNGFFQQTELDRRDKVAQTFTAVIFFFVLSCVSRFWIVESHTQMNDVRRILHSKVLHSKAY